MNNFYLIVPSLLLSILFHHGPVSATPPAEARPATIAVILPLTGPGAPAGKSFQNGAKLALSMLPESKRTNLKLVFEDDQMVARNTISSFQKIMAQQQIDLAVTVTANTGKALAPVAEKAGVLFLAAVSRDTGTCEGRRRCAIFWPSPADVIALALAEIRKQGWKKIALISTVHDGPFAMVREIDRQKKDEDFSFRDEYLLEVTDFRPFLVKVRAKAPDVILVNLFQSQIGIFARQAHEMGIKIPRLGLEIHGEESEWQVARGAMKGEAYIGIGFSDPLIESKYREAYPGDTAYAASVGYDLVQLITDAYDKHGPTLGDYFEQVKDFHGASGIVSRGKENRLLIMPQARVVPR